jgi:NO-binding membrane sensor protein with MHYT domain
MLPLVYILKCITNCMKIQPVAWTLITGTAAVTAVGAFVPEPAMAVGSVVLGGAALVTALQTRIQLTRQRISEKMLEQMR